jgi:RNA polymerase sigma-70 factor (ECF subfamily)
VFRFARRRVGEEDAREAVAETFMVAWRRLEEIPPASLPWLLVVCRNVIANQRRGERRRGYLARRLRRQAGAAEPDVAGATLRAEVARRAFRSLSRRDRDVLAVSGWDRLSPADAAAYFDCSPSAYANRLQRARRRFEAALAREEHPPTTIDSPTQELT